ncbi:MAG: hypothetical protein EAZ85_01830 [Bacteroidetes bacterium]|nr:MAG: hypothetical protein EAZ85_01830 [Bacteroidota bacterium]TAG90380.1 MAG: hypothetical protein EAZ20_04430 [Bacteroidota bacterium]
MKYLLLFIFFFPFFIFAQQQEISQTITDEKGEGIPGVSIHIKGTTTATSTDLDGKYTIKTKIGDILVIEAIGMKTREVLVTKDGLVALKEGKYTHRYIQPNIIQPKNKPIKDSVEFNYEIFMGKDTSFAYKNAVDFSKQAKKVEFKNKTEEIPTFTELPQNIKIRKNKIILSSIPTKDYFKPYNFWHIDYSTSFDFLESNKLPKLQNQFAQGRPINGQNAWVQNDIFSWGENIKKLEYDNNNALVALGTGNGRLAQSFNPLQILRTGYIFKNNLIISKRWQYWTFKTHFSHQKQQGIIPNQTNEQTDIQALFTHQRKQKLTFNVIFNNIQQQLPNIGANWQSIIGNIYRTPISFDNQNNFNLSHSPQTDNPYFYQNIVPDNSLERNLTLGIVQNSISIKKQESNEYLLGYALNYNLHQKQTAFGLLPAMAGSATGRYTDRKMLQQSLNGNIETKYEYQEQYRSYNAFFKDFSAKLRYDYAYQDTNLDRKDGQGFNTNQTLNIQNANQITNTNIQLDRHIHEFFINFGVNKKYVFTDNFMDLETGFRNYFSSTLLPKNYAYFLPYANLSVSIGHLLRKINITNFFRYNDSFFFHLVYGTSIQETSLLYNQFQFNSLQTNAENYGQYFENKELQWKNGLAPEKNRKLDISLHFDKKNYPSYQLSATITRFIHQKSDMIVPIFENNNFSLQNAIDMRNSGWELKLEYTKFFKDNNSYIRDASFNSVLILSRFNPVVTHLANQRESVALAGYKDISTQAIVGQPLGVIVGNTYLRNQNGQKIIDGQGFPLVNVMPQILGNPNPDFILTWLNKFQVKDFSLSILFEYRKGGQVWNGTKNALNYLGRSEQSANERNITNFVFEGVNLLGQSNQIPVDFANPINGLSGNRFVRYGFVGVGEDTIESATSFRLREVNFSHNFTKYWKKIFPKSEATFTLYAQNLLMYMPYSGVDAQTMLMNYQAGIGLDLFNMPAMRTFGGKLQMSF